MLAFVLHGPGRYAVERNWPTPVPEPGWALVRVAFSGVCGSDLPRFSTTGSYRHPMILGHEFSGVVEKPAAGPARLGEGARVAVMPIIPCGACDGCRDRGPFHCRQYRFLGSRDDGGFAQYAAVPEDNLFALPEGMDMRHGALLEPLAVALHVVRVSGFAAGEKALVLGCGAIGILIAQWLRVFGAESIAVADVRPESRRLAERCGFAETFSPLDPDFMQAVRGRGHVFEAAGSNAALLAGVEALAAKGTITVVGRDSKDTSIPLKSFETLMRKEALLRGCWGYDLRRDQAFLHRALFDGRFAFEPLITHSFPLGEADKAIELMLGGKEFYGKVLLDCRK